MAQQKTPLSAVQMRELEWTLLWGSPRDLYRSRKAGQFVAAFVLAVLFHSLPMSYFWEKSLHKVEPSEITLQSVDLIEIVPQTQITPVPQQVEQPKSALDFLKMALPKFSADKPVQPPMPEVKPIEPAKLEDKGIAPPAPEIKLDLARQAPQIADLTRTIEKTPVAAAPADPTIKLEAVGRKAAPPSIQAPQISLSKNLAVTDVAQPKIQTLAPASQSATPQLVDKSPASYAAKPSASLPYGYARPGESRIALDPTKVKVVQQQVSEIKSVVKQEAQKADVTISKKGVSISGPLSSRKIVKSLVPEYPQWAREKGVQADVSIRFYVSPKGEVRERMIVERTSGYPELDRLAKQSLLSWQFSTDSGSTQDQWGVITFRFVLE